MVRYLLLLLIAVGCSSHKAPIRVGIDPNWNEIDPRGRERYLGGFTEELLLEVSTYDGAPFELIYANPDSLYDGLARGQYDVVVSALPRYSYNQARYDFSEDMIALGPVLVVPQKSRIKSLRNIVGSVGLLEGSRDGLLLTPYPDLQMRSYPSVAALLEAVARGETQGVLLDRLTAEAFVRDLYAGQLRIATKPLTPEGIHFTAPKGNPYIHRLETAVKSLRKKKKLQALREKWGL